MGALRKSDLYENGYGIIARKVLTDKSIDAEAKAIYSYFCVYAGVSGQAYPSVERACEELNMSERRFRKYRQQLVDAGYITIEKKKAESGFDRNLYVLNGAKKSRASKQNVSAQNVPCQIDSTIINSSSQVTSSININQSKESDLIDSQKMERASKKEKQIEEAKSVLETEGNFLNESQKERILESFRKALEAKKINNATKYIMKAIENEINAPGKVVSINKNQSTYKVDTVMNFSNQYANKADELDMMFRDNSTVAMTEEEEKALLESLKHM